MTQEGKLLTCDRCGDTVFVPKNGTQFNVIDGCAEESSTYAPHDPNWGYLTCYPKVPDIENFKGLSGLETDFESKLLCPSCRSEFSRLMHNFWRMEAAEGYSE